MMRQTFILLTAFAVGILGFTGAEATAFPVMIKPAIVADVTSDAIVDVRYGGGGNHGGGYHGGGHYNRPAHRPAYRPGYHPGYRPHYNHWNGYGRRCNGWTNYCRYHYNGYWYSNQWWIAPAVGVGVGVAIANSNNSSRHVAWCESRYRSYNPRNNTWISNSGQVRQCNSPYN